MKNRSELREIAMKCIYQVLVLKTSNLDYNIDDIIHELLEVENDFVLELVNGVVNNFDNLEELANKYMNDWTIDRLNLVDQSIMFLGIYELTNTNTPSIVAINECIELAKKYSDLAVVKMINGVLDNIYHNEANNDE